MPPLTATNELPAQARRPPDPEPVPPAETPAWLQVSWARVFATVAAVIGLSAIGGGAIWYIHETTPEMPSGAPAQRTAGGRVPLTVVDTPGGGVTPRAAAAGAVTPPAAPYSTAVPLAPPTPATTPATTSTTTNGLPRLTAPSANLGWSPADRLKNGPVVERRPENTTPGAQGGAPIGPTAGTISINRSPALPGSPATANAPPSASRNTNGSASPPPSPNGAIAGSGNAAASGVPQSSLGTPATGTTATPQNGTIARAQDAECATSGSVGRFFCNEKVRLKFCQDRWNRHPDCVVAQSNQP